MVFVTGSGEKGGYPTTMRAIQRDGKGRRLAGEFCPLPLAISRACKQI
jgi:hypothetical protein